MIDYKVVHHVPGRIRLKVPMIKKLSIVTLKKLAELPVPEGIKNVDANPITGSLVIKYDPAHVNILKFVEEMVKDKELLTTVGAG